MNREDIIAMAREAGWKVDAENEVLDGDEYHIQTDIVKRFAALVEERTLTTQKARHYQEGYEAGVHDEREACAKVCEQRKIITPEWQLDQHYNQGVSHCAAAPDLLEALQDVMYWDNGKPEWAAARAAIAKATGEGALKERNQ